MPCNNNVPSLPVVSDERIRNELRKRIHRAVHIDKSHTRETLHTESGVALHHIDAIVSTDKAKHRRVAAEDALSIAYALGEPTINALLGLFGYGSAQPVDVPDADQPAKAVANAMKHLSIIAGAAADNRIDHTEEAMTREAADCLIAEVINFSSAGRAQ